MRIAFFALVAVPITMKYGKGRQENRRRITYVSTEPSESPSSMPSVSPSSMPSSTRFTEIVEALQPISGRKLREQGSPQYLAAMWMADTDPMQLPVGSAGSNDGRYDRFKQRYIMALFYFALDGANWLEDRGWLSEDSECFWFGIDGASEGCGGEDKGGCIERSVFEGDYDKVCRVGMGEF